MATCHFFVFVHVVSILEEIGGVKLEFIGDVA